MGSVAESSFGGHDAEESQGGEGSWWEGDDGDGFGGDEEVVDGEVLIAGIEVPDQADGHG